MAEEYGKIRKSLLTDIANAIRVKKDTTAIFTPEQMAEEIGGIADIASMTNAEDTSFGTVTSSGERLIINAADLTPTRPSSYAYNNEGFSFLANETFSVEGFLHFGTGGSRTFQLWDLTNGVKLAETSGTSADGVWNEHKLTIPVNCLARGVYAVTTYVSDAYSRYQLQLADCVANNKVTFRYYVSGTAYDTAPGEYPTHVPNNPTAVDLIVSATMTESATVEYKIQIETMTDIADEVKRITGTTGKMTTAQIQSGLESVILQEKTVTPSTEQQVITPDSGFYGISKVTVGAVEQTESSGSMFSTTAVGILPTVYKGAANSECSLSFESSAVGALSE